MKNNTSLWIFTGENSGKQESILTAPHWHFTLEKVFRPRVCQTNSTIEIAHALSGLETCRKQKLKQMNWPLQDNKFNKSILVIFHIAQWRQQNIFVPFSKNFGLSFLMFLITMHFKTEAIFETPINHCKNGQNLTTRKKPKKKK